MASSTCLPHWGTKADGYDQLKIKNKHIKQKAGSTQST